MGTDFNTRPVPKQDTTQFMYKILFFTAIYYQKKIYYLIVKTNLKKYYDKCSLKFVSWWGVHNCKQMRHVLYYHRNMQRQDKGVNL